MAYLQTTCVIGTLAISASNSCALGSIVISDTMSPGPEFNGNCNLIAIGQNTTLTGSLGLDISTLTLTQAGLNFNASYSYYQRNLGCSKPVILTGGGAGTGAIIKGYPRRYTNYYAGVPAGGISSAEIIISNPGCGYTSTVTGTICDPTTTGETCALFTIQPLNNENSINIGHSAGCRSQGSNTIRIGSCAGRGNITNSYCLHTDSIAIGSNTMISGSFIDSIAIGENALKGNTYCTNIFRCIKDNVVIGKNSLCNFKSRTCFTTIVGNCNLHNACCMACNTVLGYCNGFTVCSAGSVNTIIGFNNACICGTNKTIGSSNTVIGCGNFKCSMAGTGNIAIGLYNMCGGIQSGNGHNYAIGYQNLRDITTADYNVGLGYYTGYATTTGQNNVYIGQWAGRSNNTGARSVYIGCGTGCGMGNQNDSIFIGSKVGAYGGSDQGGHIAIGIDALRNMCSGYFNTVIGYAALCVQGQTSSTCAISGGCNIAIGPYAGQCVKGASCNNIYIGQRSGPTVSGAETYKFYLGQDAGNHLMCGCLNSSGKSLTISGSVDFGTYTSTAVSTTGPIDPNQNNQAPTQDTLATLTVDPSGNVVRGEQEATFKFTTAQLNSTLGQTLISAPGAGKAVVVTYTDWMMEYTSVGSTTNNLEIRQANLAQANASVAILPALRFNEIVGQSQSGTSPFYGFYTRDIPTGAGSQGRTYAVNKATTIHKQNSGAYPSGLTSISIKLRYRVFDVSTF
jgi:hypothetical protein